MSKNKTIYTNLKRKPETRTSGLLPTGETYLGGRDKKSSDTPVGKIKDTDVDFALSQIDRENHTHVLGSTGRGNQNF